MLKVRQVGEPDPCPTCKVQAVKRAECKLCGGTEWVYDHKGHYKWGREVVPCPCGEVSRKERARLVAAEKREKDLAKGILGKHGKTTPVMAKKAAELLSKGVTPYKALREAGFPKGSYNRGKAAINSMVRAEINSLGRKYIEYGKDLTVEDQEALVRGRLVENTILGSDKGVLSAKQLGADKRVAMWQAESQTGLVVLQAPQIREIRHEVPILPPIELELEEETDATTDSTS